jgi:hypothetical protein
MHANMIMSLVLVASLHLAFANPTSHVDGVIDSETPPFDVVAKGATYEVRRYYPEIWAQVEYTVDPSTDINDKSSIGFQPLFEYITGKNERQQKIPMTAPVVMQQLTADFTRRSMAFIMPASQFTRVDQLPKPTASDVTLVTVNQPLVLACITFNMETTTKRVAEKEAELREGTKGDGIDLVNDRASLRVGGYNPPWTPPELRKNEVCIPLVNQA